MIAYPQIPQQAEMAVLNCRKWPIGQLMANTIPLNFCVPDRSVVEWSLPESSVHYG